jgi:choline monooxygenase
MIRAMAEIEVDPDIRRARTPIPELYGPALYQRSLASVLARTWHVVAEGEAPPEPGSARPLALLPGSLDEPLALTCDARGEVALLSNVCTHRANLVVNEPCKTASLRCRYHGRRFGLDGRFKAMPGFEEALDFPSAADDLPRVATGTWGPLRFASLDPGHDLAAWLAPLVERTAFLDLGERPLEELRTYDVGAHWALYVENYLEGLHIPFVHPSLDQAVDFATYRTELEPLATVQVAVARPGELAFDLPLGHRDHGQRIAAYYVWLFPGTMVNVYPWGLSINVVRPQGADRTRVIFASCVVDAALRDRGAGAGLHQVELEDEAVVEAVQRGVRSRLYRGGRYSPSRETGVHHFHRLLASSLA